MDNNKTNQFELTDEMLEDVSGGRSNYIVITNEHYISMLNQGICPRCRGTLKKRPGKIVFGGVCHQCMKQECPNPYYYLRPDGKWVTLP